MSDTVTSETASADSFGTARARSKPSTSGITTLDVNTNFAGRLSLLRNSSLQCSGSEVFQPFEALTVA